MSTELEVTREELWAICQAVYHLANGEAVLYFPEDESGEGLYDGFSVPSPSMKQLLESARLKLEEAAREGSSVDPEPEWTSVFGDATKLEDAQAKALTKADIIEQIRIANEELE